MAADPRTSVSVTIMKREYRVQCAADEVQALQAAARHLDERMRQFQTAVGEGTSQDRLAIMVALNIVNDHLAGIEAQAVRLDRLTEKVSAALPSA